MGTLDTNIVAGGSSTPISPGTKLAQIYTAGLSGVLDQIDLYLYKYSGVTSDIVVELWSVSSGLPNAKIADLGSILAGDVTVAYAWRTLAIASGPTLTANTQYALVFYASGGSGNQYATYSKALSTQAGKAVYHDGTSWKRGFGIANQKTYIDSSVSLNLAAASGGAAIAHTNHFATKFTASATGELDKAEAICLLYAGSYAAINFTLRNDNAGIPGSIPTNGSLGRVAYTSMDATYATRTVTPSPGPDVVSGTDYWHVINKDNTDGAGNIALYFGWLDNDVEISTDGGTTWNSQNAYFKTYVAEGGGSTLSPIMYHHYYRNLGQ